MNITIAGGGSTAHALIPFLAGAGHTVRLLTRRPSDWARLVAVQHRTVSGDILQTYVGHLTLASNRPEDVVPGADIVILCMPVSHYWATLNSIAPHIRDPENTYVGTIYGQGGFNWMVNAVQRRHSLPRLRYFTIGLVPWICRTLTYGQIGITYGPKAVNVAAVFPSGDFAFLDRTFFSDLCVRWFNKGAFCQSANFISLTMSVDNQIIHPTRCYGLFLEYGGKWPTESHVPFFYRDYDELSASLLREVDDEYSRIRNALRVKYPDRDFGYMLDYLALERLSYQSHNDDIKESFISSKTLGAIRTPVIQTATGEWGIDTDCRFFTDDIHYGLCIAKWLAEKLDIHLPRIDSIIQWAQQLRGERLVANHRLITNGREECVGHRVGVPSAYGLNSVDEIID
jgi:hypothetical protein